MSGMADAIRIHSQIGRDESGQFCKGCGHRYGYAAVRRLHSKASEHVAEQLSAAGFGDVRELQARIDGENKHWDAWDVYVNSGNIDGFHRKVFHAYVDEEVSYEYMAATLSTGPAFKHPCEHDDDFEFGDPERPACEHCNRAALTATEGT